MMVLSERAAQVCAAIEAAFSGLAYPGDAHLVYDNSGHHLECAEVAAAFRGKHWKDLSADFLRHHASSLWFMTPEGYRFYLPAYLLATVTEYDVVDMVPSVALFSLTPSNGPIPAHLFSEEQRAAIRLWLELLKDEHAVDFPAPGGLNRVSDALHLWAE